MTFRRLKCSPLEVFWRCYLGLFKSTATGEPTRNNLNVGLIRDVGICKLMNEWGDFKQCLAVKQKERLVPDAESDLGSVCSKAVWRCPSDCRFRGHLEPTSFTPSSQGRPRSAASSFWPGPLNSEHLLSWHPRFLAVFEARLPIREGPCGSPWDRVPIQYLLQASVGLSEPVPSLV